MQKVKAILLITVTIESQKLRLYCRCARRRSEKRSNARAATKDETRGTNDAEAQPPHGEHTQGPLELEEGMSNRERTETNRDTAQTADSDPANTLTEKVFHQLTCDVECSCNVYPI